MKTLILTLALGIASIGAVLTSHEPVLAKPQLVPTPSVTVYRMYYANPGGGCMMWRDFQSLTDANNYRALSAPGTFTAGVTTTTGIGPASRYAWPGMEGRMCPM